MTFRSMRCEGRCIRTGPFAALWLLLAAAPLWAADHPVQASVGVDYSRGNYGGSTDTAILSVPVAMRARRGRWQFDASLPWLRVSGDRNIVPGMGLLGTGLLGTGGPSTERRTASGIGDLALAARYAFDAGHGLGIALGARAKIATADERRGLGTGANDHGVTLDLYRGFGNTTWFAGAGYDRLGRSPLVQADSQRRAVAGFSQAAGTGQWGLRYEQRSAVVDHAEGRRDATVFYNAGNSNGRGLRLSLSRGLSDGSPDWGVGIGLGFGGR